MVWCVGGGGGGVEVGGWCVVWCWVGKFCFGGGGGVGFGWGVVV